MVASLNFDSMRQAGFCRSHITDGTLWLKRQFYDAQTATDLLDTLIEETHWEQPIVRMGARKIPSPRLSAWYGERDAIYTYSRMVNIPLPMTSFLEAVRDDLQTAIGIRFNSVLLNYYRDGQDSIGWHRDNEPELGKEPVIASLSLGETRRFRMQHIQCKGMRSSVDLETGSMLVMADKTQQYWSHCVPKSKVRNGARVNLTFRSIQSNLIRHRY